MSEKLYGGIEAGGTKFICVVAGGPQNIQSSTRIETALPANTLDQVVAFFKREMQENRIESIGIGSFGPLDLDPASPTFGYITTTPKPDWAHTDLAGRIGRALQVPVHLDTDVNAAALGEGRWGAAKGLTDYVYLTVGTGIGGGAVSGGKVIHGLVHPEMGHMSIKHDLRNDPFEGCCPFHSDCLEGLASGTAIQKRWNRSAQDLPPDHPAWDLEAIYLAEAIVNLIYALSPRRVIVGGGVAKQPHLMPLLRLEIQKLLNNYLSSPQITSQIEEYIVSPGLGDLAGVLGAVALAKQGFHSG